MTAQKFLKGCQNKPGNQLFTVYRNLDILHRRNYSQATFGQEASYYELIFDGKISPFNSKDAARYSAPIIVLLRTCLKRMVSGY